MWQVPPNNTTGRDSHYTPNDATRYHESDKVPKRSYQRNHVNQESGMDKEVPVHIRPRNNPTFDSAIYTQNKFDSRSVRTDKNDRFPSCMGDNSEYGNFYPEFAHNRDYK